MESQYKAVSLVQKAPWEDDYEGLSNPDLESMSVGDKNELRSRLQTWWPWFAHVILLTLSASMFIGSLTTRPSDLELTQRVSAWSPAAGAIEYKSVKYNIKTENNKYVGYGPEVDRAWRELFYDVGDQMITPTELISLGMPETSIKVNNTKTGQEGYRVGLEVFHQLHCLDLLRMVTYKDHYSSGADGMLDDADHLLGHSAHCIEVLRHALTCQADVGVFTLYFKEGDPLAWPELNSQHTCRDFSKVREWAMENTVGIMVNG